MSDVNEDKKLIDDVAKDVDMQPYQAKHAARRQEIARNPTACSHCLGSARPASMYVETSGEEGKILLCTRFGAWLSGP